jgi:hypothetical protein
MSDIRKESKKEVQPLPVILKRAAKSALGGGISGAMAMAIQVTSLMWMRTIMNYQYRYGTSMVEAAKTLYSQGGVLRFYKGLAPALIQGPSSRFGDTAANVGALALLDSFDSTRSLPVAVKTVGASVSAAAFRIALMPIDAIKTNLQVDGSLAPLLAKVKAHGPGAFFHGAIATFTANFVGHYPWFFTYNILDEKMPRYKSGLKKFTRNGFIGFAASVVSDTASNSIRVIKTTKQTYATPISYVKCIEVVVQKDGVLGLFGRGLKTRIITNGAQGLMFSILWKLFQEKLNVNKKPVARGSV